MNNDNIEKRLLYFDGLFLKAQDFNDEQAYHIDRQRQHNRLFHKPGIAEGLEVRWNDADAVLEVSPGIALDSDGKLIVRVARRTFAQADLKAFAGQTVLVTICYLERPSNEPTDQFKVDEKDMATRWVEKPSVKLLPPGTSALPNQITLAQVQFDNDGKASAIDTSMRVAAGTRMIDDGSGKVASVVDSINGNFTVNGTLTVSGDINYGGALQGKGLGGGALLRYADKPMTDIEITTSAVWETVPDMVCDVSLSQPMVVLCQYVINIQPGERNIADYTNYVVQAGDSMKLIAKHTLGDENRDVELRDYNKIGSRSIQPGETIMIPIPDETVHQALGGDTVGVRLVVDGKPFGESGSHFTPVSDPLPANANLHGVLTVLLNPGDHKVELQWFKAGTALKSWRCATASAGEGDSAGFIAGRSLTVLAFAQ